MRFPSLLSFTQKAPEAFHLDGVSEILKG
jgi:hypothetical protein